MLTLQGSEDIHATSAHLEFQAKSRFLGFTESQTSGPHAMCARLVGPASRTPELRLLPPKLFLLGLEHRKRKGRAVLARGVVPPRRGLEPGSWVPNPEAI